MNDDHMALDDALGRLFMVGFDGVTPTPGVIDLIERDRVGGIILFSRNCRDANQTWELTTRLQEIARAAGHRRPLLISIDQENGLVSRLGPGATIFPGAMALGAADSEALTAAVAEASGQELRAVGVNMNFAPVADVNNNPANPVIGARSFGEDPALVARHVAATARGFHQAGVITTLKHFPGHGDTAVDSHRALASVPDDPARLNAIELPPFRAGIAAGADCVMTAHIALPRLTGGADVPATLAHAVLTGLLRDELGFTGVVVTDCLEMDAIAKGVGIPAGAVAALGAGADIVLISHTLDQQRAAIAAAREAIAQGTLSDAAVRRSAARIDALKRQHLSWESLPIRDGLRALGSDAHRTLSAGAYDRAITLIRDDRRLIPLPAESGRLVVLGYERGSVSAAIDLPYSPSIVTDRLRERYSHDRVAEVILSPNQSPAGRKQARQTIRAADTVLLVTLNAHLDAQQRRILQEALADTPRVIGLAVGNPYDCASFPSVGAYLAAYEYTAPAIEAAIRLIFGDYTATGHLPVSVG